VRGWQLTFFTQQDRHAHGKPLAHWLLEEARALGIRGATLITAAEGLGHNHRLHSAHFFDLADQPMEVVMAVTEEEADRLFARLSQEKIRLFYVRTAVEFGTVGGEEQGSGGGPA
jgi:PII-like signaling protein